MNQPRKFTVQRRDDRQWEAIDSAGSRASAVADTQAAAASRARQILRNSGGGEVAIRGLNGQIRTQDTVRPGRDPRRSQG